MYDESMDIVTHAMIGAASSAGVFSTHPGFACGIVLGNVLPDLDAFSRVAGKHAFMKFHQTYTHSLAAISIPFFFAFALYRSGNPIWAELAMGLALGMVMHIGLDLTNSYGVRCLWPICSRRFALDWIFFIDLPIIVLSVIALLACWMLREPPSSLMVVSASYVVLLLIVVAVRGTIARRIRVMESESSSPQANSVLIPTTFSPFRFIACREADNHVELWQVNAISGQIVQENAVEILDDVIPVAVKDTKEWSAMRELSPYFHAVEQEEGPDVTIVVCRDLRIRNFGTRFGSLTCRIAPDGHIIEKKWEV
ncbi:inner membrane protein [Novipirellula aureliae]|uniref:Inner membrane protein n=2 Tax=Novipirellula aureliae TaxID=2527966 RepID=A0A5C6DV81_9BACT|nr:inner membrane protein [Novipirellula aureliae]